jgi:hypothetical protein
MPGVHVDVALNDLNATWEQEHAEHQIVEKKYMSP